MGQDSRPAVTILVTPALEEVQVVQTEEMQMVQPEVQEVQPEEVQMEQPERLGRQTDSQDKPNDASNEL